MTEKQATNMEVKRNNRNRVFRYICRHDTVSNPDISYELKMSLPTATQITKELIGKGLVEEAGELESTGGRRAKALVLAANARQAVGLDITRNHLGLVFTNLKGEILKYERISMPFTGEDDYYRRVNEELERFLEESGAKRERLLGIGISFPGIVDMAQEMITASHILGVENCSFESISRFFSYPCHFLNDANAGAYAEGFQAESPDRFFYLSLSNSVGGAIYSQNALIQGKKFRCGEVGHMTVVPDGRQCYCKKKGCLDAYCAASRLSEMTGGKLEAFFKELDDGGKQAAEIWDDYTTYLAIAINNIHMVLDCDIVLGGYVGSYMEKHVRDIWDKVAQRDTFAENQPYVRACRYKVGAAALGAALKVVETFIKEV